MTVRSRCYVCKPRDVAGIAAALAQARAAGLAVIAHGAGHSYTDAALNTGGLILDLTGMRRILAWDPELGIMQVEPGATLRDVVRASWPDHWWPAISPSTADATIGGCVAMNVTGKNAWQCGSFGEQVLSLTLLLASGQVCTLEPARSPELFHAWVGSAGLLGIITSVTLQLRPIGSGGVAVRMRPAAALSEILSIFDAEASADFLEAWIDGFATGGQLGRGIVNCARHAGPAGRKPALSRRDPAPGRPHWQSPPAAGFNARPAPESAVRLANSALYAWGQWRGRRLIRRRSLFDFTYYPPAAFASYRALLPGGVETFQVFVPRANAEIIFSEILQRSQAGRFMPLWCIIKRHRVDPFLLSYQVDGFSLELNYRWIPQTAARLRALLRELMELVVAAGGRFYLAKDALITASLYRRSIGDAAVDAFLRLKQLVDPGALFQSDLFRRVFLPSAPA